jgi:hypothetical protein
MKKATKKDKAEKKTEPTGTIKTDTPIDVEGGGAPKAEEKKEPKTETKKTPTKKAPEQKAPSITRFNAVAEVMTKAKGGLSKADIIKKADEFFAAKGGKSNEQETTWTARVTLQVLKAFNRIEAQDGKYKLING